MSASYCGQLYWKKPLFSAHSGSFQTKDHLQDKFCPLNYCFHSLANPLPGLLNLYSYGHHFPQVSLFMYHLSAFESPLYVHVKHADKKTWFLNPFATFNKALLWETTKRSGPVETSADIFCWTFPESYSTPETGLWNSRRWWSPFKVPNFCRNLKMLILLLKVFTFLSSVERWYLLFPLNYI